MIRRNDVSSLRELMEAFLNEEGPVPVIDFATPTRSKLVRQGFVARFLSVGGDRKPRKAISAQTVSRSRRREK